MSARSSICTFALAATAFACSSQGGPTQASYDDSPPSHSKTDAGSSGGSSSGASGSGSPGDELPPGDDADAAPGEASDDASDAGPSAPDAGDDAPESTTQPDAAPACVKGQVQPSEVVMLGDSYLDPAWGNVGPTLMTEAGAMYRHYYIGAASMAWGNPDTQFYIPYQYDPMALTDTAVPDPSDIKVVIMDGGGNDVLIGNTSCETMAPPANTSCVTTVQNAIDEAHTEMLEMAQKGVQSVVYFFYPHLNPAGGGILQTPAPAVNDTLDYAYPLAEKMCCGSSFTSSMTSYSCYGEPVPGLHCAFIDTRPAFEGHLADYIKSDNVHPTQAGAQVISDLVWAQMQAHCIAQ